jgi:hypothetical protein
MLPCALFRGAPFCFLGRPLGCFLCRKLMDGRLLRSQLLCQMGCSLFRILHCPLSGL